MTKHCCLLVGLLVPMAAWPQAGTSTIRGLVRDQAQAVIPGAKVTLTNMGTAVARESQTNSSGFYTFPAVTAGSYRIAVESPGMNKFEGNLQVQTAQDASVDVVLQTEWFFMPFGCGAVPVPYNATRSSSNA